VYRKSYTLATASGFMGLFAIAHALTVGKEGGNYLRLEVIKWLFKEFPPRPNRLFYSPIAIIRGGYWRRLTGGFRFICHTRYYQISETALAGVM
jgi:hypothetical protein